MKTILNIIWLVLCGFWMALGYLIAGIICCILIITIPFGIASFRMANYALWPFGRTVVRKPTAGAASTIGNVIWILVAGIWLAIGHITTGIAMCLTIIGIPLGFASFKMVPVSLLPLGAEIVSTDQPAGVYAPPPPGQYYPPSA
ncbi:YccF domain-containing protein [Gordonia sp. CPCC 205333]|uniref:YccF domain-containing protein n=1 Tax=Gordonia sp. CPCC 205333 TaxID=3140790 RepID=UPI003AF4072E